MLRIAIPNKGQLAEPAKEMLREAGYLASVSEGKLVINDPLNDAEFFFLRPKDVAIYVGSGKLDLGITGRDMLSDSAAPADEILELGFGTSTFRLAAPIGTASSIADVSGKRIACSYPTLLQNWLNENKITAKIVKLDGAVENAVALGVADWVADVVATGTTLRQAGLEIIGQPLFDSEAIVVRRKGAEIDPVVETFVRRLQGVMVARAYVLVDYDIKRETLKEACAITPGIESPTVSDLADPNWAAVRAMVLKADVHGVMDSLYEIGARGILVTDIHACRL
jgi:ATP phosphoribosyltransferase